MTAFLVRVASLALLLGGLGGGVESFHLALDGRWHALPVVGGVAFALSWLFAWPAALLAHVHDLFRARVPGRFGRLALVLGACGILVALAAWTIEPSGRRLYWLYWLIAGCFGVGGAGLLFLASEQSSGVRVVGGVAGVTAALGLDALFQRHQYSELHSLLFLGFVVACLPIAAWLRERWGARSPRTLMLVALLPTVAALLGLAKVDVAFPWWRFEALHHGRVVAASTRIIQRATDFDGDGASALAWGGDCNDRDPRIFPLAPDPPGNGDSNCNGVDADGTSHGDLVLGPATGSPALPPQAEPRRVMMFVLDALRLDFFTPEHMPRMVALAERGLRLRRCYASGTETATSVPLMHLPTGSAPTVLRPLRQAGVRVIDGESTLASLPAADRDAVIARGNWDAIRQGALSLATQTSGSFLFWSHPMSIHDHGSDKSRFEVPASPAHVPASYKRAVRNADTILGELWDALAARGLTDNLTWILTADHGEAFGEAGMYYHGAGAPDALLHVPCALWGPGLPAVAVDELASQRGLPATLLGLFGLEDQARGAEYLGRSWLRWLADPRARLQKLVVARSGRGSSGRVTEGHLLVLLDEHYRFVSAPEEGSFELFAVDDQDLTHDLSPDLPDMVRHYRRLAAIVSDEDGYPVQSFSARVLKQLYDM